jgi:hypothetical protein
MNEADNTLTTLATDADNIQIGAPPTPADAGDAADNETETFQFPSGWDMEAEIRGVLGLARVTMNMAAGANDDYDPQLFYLSDRLFAHHELLHAGWLKLRRDHFAELKELHAQLAAAQKRPHRAARRRWRRWRPIAVC